MKGLHENGAKADVASKEVNFFFFLLVFCLFTLGLRYQSIDWDNLVERGEKSR